MLDFIDSFFVIFFQPDYVITWDTIDHDSRFAVENSIQVDSDSRYAIQNSVQIDHDSRFSIYTTENIDHDTTFDVQAVALCDTSYVVSATPDIDHDVRLVIQGPSINIDHAILLTIREEDSFTN